jgi:hypothetical protein
MQLLFISARRDDGTELPASRKEAMPNKPPSLQSAMATRRAFCKRQALQPSFLPGAMALPKPEAAYLEKLVGTLQMRFESQLVGVYLFGSAAYSAYEPGISDLDVQAVVTKPLGKRERQELAGFLTHRTLPCPARRLEFVCYARPSIRAATRHPQFEINFNTGPGEQDHLSIDSREESSHWFLLDIALGRALGRPLVGPKPAQVFAAIPRLWQLQAIADSLAWHGDNEPTSPNAVSNACRGWRFAETGAFGSKLASSAWARQQPACPAVVEEAESHRRSGSALCQSGVTKIVKIVTEAVQAAIRRERATLIVADSNELISK